MNDGSGILCCISNKLERARSTGLQGIPISGLHLVQTKSVVPLHQHSNNFIAFATGRNLLPSQDSSSPGIYHHLAWGP